MAEKLGDAVLHLRTDDSKLDEGLDEAESKARGLAVKFEAMGERMAGVGKKLSIGLTAPLILFGKEAISTASDAAELQSAFDVTFGSMAGAMNQWAETTGNAMGRSTQEIQKGANMFGLFFNQAAPTKQAAAEMSQSFTVLAQDLSSFFNVDPGEALEKLRSGLSGETEPLRDFGIFLTEATVQAKAYEMGLAPLGGALTEQNKVMARAALIMEATKNAQGDVARTSGGTANQVRAAKAAYEELQVTIGTKLLPVITPLITKVAGLLDGFSHLPGPVQTAVVALLGVATVLGPLMIGFGAVAGPIGGALTAFKAFKTGFDMMGLAKNVVSAVGLIGKGLLTLAMNPVFLVIAALIAAIYLAWANWDKIKPIIDAVGNAISGWWNGTVKPVLAAVGEGIKQVVGFFTDLFGAQIKAVVDMVSKLFKGDFAGAWEAAKQLVMTTVNAWLKILDTIVPGARATIAKLISGFGTWFGNLASQMITFGRNIIEGLVRGIKAAPQAVWNALKDIILAGVKKAREFLGIQSPSRLFMEMGGHITDGLAIGIRNGIDTVRDAMGDLGKAVADGMPKIGATRVGAEAAGSPDEEQGQRWRDGFRQWFRDGLKAAADGDLGGFLSSWLKGVADRMLDNLADKLSNLLLTLIGGGNSGAAGGILGGIAAMGGGGGGGLGGILGGIGKLFAGMFAGGGTIPFGQFGIVGERGPERVISTPRGTVVRPNRALSEGMRSAGPSVAMPISIDATGADPAGLARVQASLDRLRSELPGRIVSTIQDASDRRLLRGSA